MGAKRDDFQPDKCREFPTNFVASSDEPFKKNSQHNIRRKFFCRHIMVAVTRNWELWHVCPALIPCNVLHFFTYATLLNHFFCSFKFKKSINGITLWKKFNLSFYFSLFKLDYFYIETYFSFTLNFFTEKNVVSWSLL